MGQVAVGQVIGTWKVVRLLGSGGMADVYEAEDLRLGRHVALKILPQEYGRQPDFIARFEREVRASAALSHIHIVTVFDCGAADGYHFYAMRLLPGGDLRDRIQLGLSIEAALKVLRAMLQAFAHAHARGFVHRDVKPENILFDEAGTPVLSDFGIAKALDSHTKVTQTGMAVGTPRYISPEQATGKAVDGRSDLYSLGCILYEMLTGGPPYRAETPIAMIFRHVSEPVPQLEGVAKALQPLLDRLMAKAPEQRFQTAEEALQMLDAEFPPQRWKGLLPAPAQRMEAPEGLQLTPVQESTADQTVVMESTPEYAPTLVLPRAASARPAIADLVPAQQSQRSAPSTPNPPQNLTRGQLLLGLLGLAVFLLLLIGLGRQLLQPQPEPVVQIPATSTPTPMASPSGAAPPEPVYLPPGNQRGQPLEGTLPVAPTRPPATPRPTLAATAAPTATPLPTRAPSPRPTARPSLAPTAPPTRASTLAPNRPPTQEPTLAPTQPPTPLPTAAVDPQAEAALQQALEREQQRRQPSQDPGTAALERQLRREEEEARQRRLLEAMLRREEAEAEAKEQLRLQQELQREEAEAAIRQQIRSEENQREGAF